MGVCLSFILHLARQQLNRDCLQQFPLLRNAFPRADAFSSDRIKKERKKRRYDKIIPHVPIRFGKASRIRNNRNANKFLCTNTYLWRLFVHPTKLTIIFNYLPFYIRIYENDSQVCAAQYLLCMLNWVIDVNKLTVSYLRRSLFDFGNFCLS